MRCLGWAQWLAILVVLGLIFLSIHQGNVISCERSNVVRTSQLGFLQYVKDAAKGRDQAAKIASTAAQSSNDRKVAAKFRKDAAAIEVKLIPCGGIFPEAK